ncbi:fatty acid 2-hydroxylase [Reticulomyxa filosa]|uniref:Fatty acid 2-hydroxylase n=1 Tax=Reticulomyxa filosa TaxID=46433 RepID=X6P1Q5_RETFI|nr:fatty acid 2-hydroxylase [Reticulomyxa filosa]|eukprot:ETO31482.1 fatty acid 2-hydroxylase [Reticulomyxa filosa]
MTQTTTLTSTISNTEKQRAFIVDHNKKQSLPNGNIIDWKKGLFNQIALVGECYDEWIEHPKLGRCRLFDSNIRESFSFTPWWVVPALYIPWSLLETRYSLTWHDSIFYQTLEQLGVVKDWYEYVPVVSYVLLAYLFGIFFWTFFEYVCHRFAFHWHPKTPLQRYAHFLGHGLHHITPEDEFRLVFPPVISIPLALMFRTLFYKTFPYGFGSAFFGGFLLGYAAYESTHFLTHHMPFGSWLKNRFYYHSKHHFDPVKQGKIFGVSSQFWDIVFGTL